MWLPLQGWDACGCPEHGQSLLTCARGLGSARWAAAGQLRVPAQHRALSGRGGPSPGVCTAPVCCTEERSQGQAQEPAAPSCLGSWQMGPGVIPHLCRCGGPQGLLFFQNQEIEELTKICDELIAKLGKAD